MKIYFKDGSILSVSQEDCNKINNSLMEADLKNANVAYISIYYPSGNVKYLIDMLQIKYMV